MYTSYSYLIIMVLFNLWPLPTCLWRHWGGLYIFCFCHVSMAEIGNIFVKLFFFKKYRAVTGNLFMDCATPELSSSNLTCKGPSSVPYGLYLDRTLGNLPPIYGPHLYGSWNTNLVVDIAPIRGIPNLTSPIDCTYINCTIVDIGDNYLVHSMIVIESVGATDLRYLVLGF